MDLYNLIISAKLSKGEGGDVSVDPLSVTENGTYTAPSGHAYSPVTVNVPSVTPTGNIDITSTAQTDVSAYATAQVVDADLVASNIKKDVNILGVTGTYEGGGGGDTTLKNLIEGNGTSIIIPDGITKIRGYLFRSAPYENIVIPDSVTEIGNYAFAYASSLKTITCKAVNPPTIVSNSLQQLTALEAIYVPAASVGAYKSAGTWSSFASKIQAIPE